MKTQPPSHPRSLFAPMKTIALFAFILTFGPATSTYGAELLLITDPDSLGNPADPLAFDQELIEMLEDRGHNVVNAEDREDVVTFASAFRDGPPTEEQLEGIDLIVMSRGANSGQYDDGTEPDDWNSLEIPLILLSPYQTRTSRWGWINSSQVINAGPAPEEFDPFPDPDHPFVAGLSTSVFPPDDVIDYINSMDVPDDATVVATLTIGGNITPAILDIPEGTELFTNAQGVESITGERRVLYQMLDYVDNDDIFRISENGFEVLHQIIETLAPSAPPAEGPSFVRGDFDQDGRILLSDGVAILIWLFQGGADPACLDSADVDDSGTILVNDAILVFGYLFVAESTPPAAPAPSQATYPATDCGVDPTADDPFDCARSAETCGI